jgi:hypothetical protein
MGELRRKLCLVANLTVILSRVFFGLIPVPRAEGNRKSLELISLPIENQASHKALETVN